MDTTDLEWRTDVPSRTADEAIARLERVLQDGWVWEAGNYPAGHYWAQAMGREIKNAHPRVGFAAGVTLKEALDELRRMVLAA